MRFFHYFLFMLWFLTGTGSGYAQPLKENEIVVIQGEKFVLHQVRTGETIYSISRNFQVSSQELVNHNPQIEEGLKIGEILKIPYREDVEWQDIPVSPKGEPAYFDYHTISSRTETPYFIAKEFDITVEEIYAFNPEVTRFKKGTRLRIPRWKPLEQLPGKEPADNSLAADERERELVMHEVKPGETLYSLARKYNLSESEILFFNPGARDLKAGSLIYLPRPDEHQEPEKPTDMDDPVTSGDQLNTAGYFEHVIASGETLWSVSRKYQVTGEELIRINPELTTGFSAGNSIKIPIREKDLVRAEPLNEEAFLKHQVEAGETLFGLASRYKMTIPELRKFNPQLANRNLIRGEVLLIPVVQEPEAGQTPLSTPADSAQLQPSIVDHDYYQIETPSLIPESCKKSEDPFFLSETCDVALFLPLFLNDNEMMNRRQGFDALADSQLYPDESLTLKNDSVVELDEPEEMFHGFYRESENFIQFYEGVLLAVDSLQSAGMKIRLNVYDTQDPEVMRKNIYSEQFLETDLILGPVYIPLQEEVSSIAAKNRIPMVSPLSSQSDKVVANPYYFQINPTREFLSAKTAELVTEEYFDSNFIVVKTNHSEGAPEERVVELVREKMAHSGYLNQPGGMKISTYDFSREGPFGFSRYLSGEKENVIFVSSMNEGDLSVVLSNINNLSGDYSITLIGFNRYEQFRSISDEYFHNLKMQYVAPYWTNYKNPETIRFLDKFKKHFHTEPDNFGMQGYDVSFYFLSALKQYGRDFYGCLPYHQVFLSQGNYQFEKISEFGGFMNQGASVISYHKDYHVVRSRVIGPWPFAQK